MYKSIYLKKGKEESLKEEFDAYFA